MSTRYDCSLRASRQWPLAPQQPTSHIPLRAQDPDSADIATVKERKNWPYQRLLDRKILASKTWYLVQWRPTWVEASKISDLQNADKRYTEWKAMKNADADSGPANPSSDYTRNPRDRAVMAAVIEAVQTCRRTQVQVDVREY